MCTTGIPTSFLNPQYYLRYIALIYCTWGISYDYPLLNSLLWKTTHLVPGFSYHFFAVGVYADGSLIVPQKVGFGVGCGSNVQIHVHTLVTLHNRHNSCTALRTIMA